MRKRLISVVTAGMLALPGLAVVPAQAAPHMFVTPAVAEVGGTSFSCQVTYFSYVPCGSVSVGPGETLSVQVTKEGAVTTGDFEAFINGTMVKGPFTVDSSDQNPRVVFTNLTTSSVVVTMKASADDRDASGLLAGNYIVTGP
ncbi:hypothetical protein [Streptomyces sp. RPT161]|uniref:hypothetical protein n=1 Tax=Streptomyces sp. RPT161 TaxID=3015993 RepID=UPI0022B8B639|nr:hypothetical protein [Streptomyces sp. RPT161]